MAADRGRGAEQPAVQLRDVLVLVVTLAAACTDALSYLGLHEVFTANMTGNTVLLGLAIARGDGGAALRSGIALAGFVLGVALVSPLLRRLVPNRRPWAGAVTAVLVVELVVLVALAGLWQAEGRAPEPPALYILIGLAALAMGAQSAAMSSLSIAGVATTYLTGMLSGLVRDIVRGRGGGRTLRLAVLVVYVGGALAGGGAYLERRSGNGVVAG